MRRESTQQDKLEKIQRQVFNQVQLTDYYHMMYLKPFECILEETKGKLPEGLKIVNRKDDLKFDVKSIKPILSYEAFSNLSKEQVKQLQDKHYEEDKQQHSYSSYKQYCVQNNADNLLCQMKASGEMEMAICVCMYNEDKDMLNNTLLGIGQNIVKLYNNGVDPDKIVVLIIQDGIEKMDKSILDFMEILQAESNIRFSQAKQSKLQAVLNQINTVQKTRQDYLWDGEDTMLDLNCFLFNKEEEEKRKALRFTNVKKEYDEVKKLYVEVQKLKLDPKVTHQDLPQKVLNIFKKQCKKYILGDADSNEEDTEQNLNKYFEEVSADIHKSRPLVQNALTKASQYCKQYIDSRLEMSHVSFFRTSQFFPEESGFSTGELSELKAMRSTKLLKIPQNMEEQRNLLRSEFQEKLAIKMNIFFVVKYKNAQKLSSHNWFFNGFCKQFSNFQTLNFQNKQRTYSPKYTILLDVGLRPDESALCKMYYSLSNHNTKIGGVCGYMGLKLQRTGQDQAKIEEDLDFFTKIFLRFVDIQRAQQLEYHFAHLIDKGFQSIFKFIHVLPGAFSGYNMKAIWGNQSQNADELLQNYFKSIGEKVNNRKFQEVNLSFWKILARVLLPNFIIKTCIEPQDKDKQTYEQLMYESNVYLAEDRILCMGIHKNGYELMFLPDAYSFVDPVKDIPSLLGQRKRWINGSYFAFEKVSNEFSQMGCFQCLNIQIWYLSLMNTLAYVAPGFFLFSISVAMEAFKADVLVKFFQDTLKEDSQIYNAFVYTINFIYAMLIFGLIYFSMNLTNKNQKFVKFVYGVSTILGVMSLIMLAILIVDLARGLGRQSSYLIQNQNSNFVEQIPGGQTTVDIIRYIVLGIMGLYAAPLLLYSICFRNLRVIFEVMAGALSFAFYTPTYLIILNIYALCRMDDLSWGTKGLDAGAGDKDAAVLDCWKIIKVIHVGKLLFWNVVVAGFMIHFGSNYLVRFYLTLALMVIIAGTMLFKVLCGILYYFYYLMAIRNKKKKGNNQLEQMTTSNSRRYISQTGSKLRIIPSLYLTLKLRTENGKSSLIDDLRNQIKQNVRQLNELAGGQAEPNIMSMQLLSFIQKGAANNVKTRQSQQLNSKINMVVSKIQQKGKDFAQKFQILGRPTNLSPDYNKKFGNVLQTFSTEEKLTEEKNCFETGGLLAGVGNQLKGFFGGNNGQQQSQQQLASVFTKGPKKDTNFNVLKK